MQDVRPGELRILFAGSPAIALPALRMIAERSMAENPPWTLAGVLTNADRCRGRKGGPESTDIGRAASSLVEEYTSRGRAPPAILKYETLKAEAREEAAALAPDLLVSFAYGRIFGPRFLGLFSLGGINVHPSLLPRHRGPSPIQEAILRRDAATGVTIQRIAAELDTGNILAQETFPLTGRETTEVLSETAGVTGAKVLQKVLEDLAAAAGGAADGAAADPVTARRAALEGVPQRGKASYCSLIKKDDGIIDWSRSALDIDAQVRAYYPWPLARTAHNGQTVNILKALPWEGREGAEPEIPRGLSREPGRVLGIDKKTGILIQTGNGILSVSLLQYQTRKALPWQAFINGARDFTGSRLTGGT
jgi:methionyl-tRNA formyltransferase